MLKVRYGSGWSRRQTASAARPRACRARHSKSARPSSGVSRPPSTAFCKVRVMVEVKGDPPAYQAQLAGQRVILLKAGLLARAQVKLNDVGKVAATEPGVQPKPRRLGLRDRARAGT